MLKKLSKILLLLTLLSINSVYAQLLPDEKKLLKQADEYFDEERYQAALTIYIKLDSLTEDVYIIHKIGACYLNSEFEKLKAIPFLEYASKSNSEKVPKNVYKDLGTIYHYTYRFDEAIEQFEKYLNKSKEDEIKNAKDISYAQRMIEICNNALELTTQNYNAEIEILDYTINTKESEYSPLISADENKLFFMRSFTNVKTRLTYSHIFASIKDSNNSWQKPTQLIISDNNYKHSPITLAGLSPDGKTIFLNIGNNFEGDIYEATIKNDSIITNIKKLNSNINSDFNEGRVSISPDGTKLFFESNRPGGYGRSDIYVSTRKPNSDWGEAINLGDIINTVYNEKSPFMHPDNKTLLFSSEGHKSIGGSDIFKSIYNNGKWSEPENLIFPNSPSDDLYFALDASGKVGYFSSSKNNIHNNHNIFKAILKDPIPLTLLKGTILAGDPPKPVNTKIKVFDKETSKEVKYIYDPDQSNGKYLMIFPPAKNYDIVIDAEGFMPQVINIHIPYQTYFYELYQEIFLNPIYINNKQIGEEITVNNIFYNLYNTNEADSLLLDNIEKTPKYYDHLLDLVENIITTTDTMKFSYTDDLPNEEKQNHGTEQLLSLIEEAIETTDSVTLSIIDANSKQKEKIKNKHFYTQGNPEISKTATIYGSDTIYSAPHLSTINTHPNYKTHKSKENNITSDYSFIDSKIQERKYIYKTTVFYDTNEDELNEEGIKILEQIVPILINNRNLGVEVYGYADSKGNESDNMTLSRLRAQNIKSFFIKNKIEKYRLLTRGYGEENIRDDNNDNRENRKVEINVFVLIEK